MPSAQGSVGRHAPAGRGGFLGVRHAATAPDDSRAAIDRLVRAGATVIAEHAAGPDAWTILADPTGDQFRVTGR
ncbi:VOC family protein [Cellulomonas sp. URHD0024]|uniref:VOC family protein n=1 Tax=Cellulomonas sp. URHD0024 TaxID=1302620 RepID=UPI00041CFD75|nr:VOC family protein [Cellulomonas sp. URHD0024]